MTEEYEPELKVWALEHFNQMAEKAVWRPEGTGCRYRKMDETTLQLEHRVDHPDSEAHHERITGLFASVNIDMIDDNPLVTNVALSAEEAFRQEMQERQAVAASWTTPEGIPLSELPLEDAYPKYLGDREVLLDNGDTHTVEDWGVVVPYTEDETGDPNTITMNPDDYNLLAGDALFMRYKIDWYRNGLIEPVEEPTPTYMVAMTRQQMFDAAESGETAILVGSTCPDTGEKVPPWMWGTCCMRVQTEETGEEE